LQRFDAAPPWEHKIDLQAALVAGQAFVGQMPRNSPMPDHHLPVCLISPNGPQVPQNVRGRYQGRSHESYNGLGTKLPGPPNGTYLQEFRLPRLSQ
jgi:hypothetical protein